MNTPYASFLMILSSELKFMFIFVFNLFIYLEGQKVKNVSVIQLKSHGVRLPKCNDIYELLIHNI